MSSSISVVWWKKIYVFVNIIIWYCVDVAERVKIPLRWPISFQSSLLPIWTSAMGSKRWLIHSWICLYNIELTFDCCFVSHTWLKTVITVIIIRTYKKECCKLNFKMLLYSCLPTSIYYYYYINLFRLVKPIYFGTCVPI